MSSPRATSSLTYRHHPTGGHSHPKGDYVDGPVAPLWPFGHGRSYTSFAIDHLRIDRTVLETNGDTAMVRVDVTNTGPRAGDEVVQLYIRDVVSSVSTSRDPRPDARHSSVIRARWAGSGKSSSNAFGLPRTSARLAFRALFPSMPPTRGNLAVLSVVDGATLVRPEPRRLQARRFPLPAFLHPGPM